MKFTVFTSAVATCIVMSMAGFGSPAYAVCNDVCLGKCKANWKNFFSSEKQCIEVWSRRNGPSGFGCGTRGGPYESCVPIREIKQRPNVPVPLPVEKAVEPSNTTIELTTAFVAPPRTIADITAILDSERPDLEKIAKRKATADATPPVSGSNHDLAWFYYIRGNARGELGRVNDAIEDANKAMEAARGVEDTYTMPRMRQFAASEYSNAGNPKQAIAIVQAHMRDAKPGGGRQTWLFDLYRQMAGYLIAIGDLEQAEGYLRRNLALIREARTSPLWTGYAKWGQQWEAHVDNHRGMVFEARGQFREAE